MPKFFEQWLRQLPKKQAKALWDYFDSEPDVVFDVIDIVAPVAKKRERKKEADK